MKLSDSPFFVAPYRDQPGGVDFLGLRQVNLDLMYQFLPGINNVTKYVRPYSVMAWFAWAFHDEMERRGALEATRKDYDAFREKVELLWSWGQQLEGTERGMVGSTSKAPNAPSDRIPLTFGAWKRKVSWLDAVNYGPSLKIDNGLGFLAQVKPGIFAVTSKGEELAKALDEQLRELTGYRMLRSTALAASEVIARSLHAGWTIDKPSAKERKVLRSALFDASAVGSDTILGLRSSAIRLFQIVLDSSRRPLQVDEVRQCLARGLTSTGRLLTIPKILVSHHHLWVVLQVRQAQRLAMEGFFAWIERQVALHGVRDSHTLAKKAAQLLARHEWFDGMERPSAVIANLKKGAATDNRALWNGSERESQDMFTVWGKLQDAIREDREEVCPLSLWMLLLDVAIYDELLALGVAHEVLDLGGVGRVSLTQWSRYVEAQGERKFAEGLLSFIETYMLSQHFGTATRRYEVGKQRLRVTIEERGLTPMIGPKKLWYPEPATDRTEAMLSLMADCGLLIWDSDGYTSVG